MATNYTITNGILKFELSGHYTFAENLELYRQGLSDAQTIAQLPNVLVDLRTSLESRTQNDMRAIAATWGRSKNHISGRIAVLVNAPHHFGLVRMLGVFCEEYNLQVIPFTDEVKALKFLTRRYTDLCE